MPSARGWGDRAGGSYPGEGARVVPVGRHGLRGGTVPLTDQEPIGGDAQRGVMMKSAPIPSFIKAQAKLLLEFLIVAFNNPAVFGNLDQGLQRAPDRQSGQPVFRGFRFFLGPFDQQPLLHVRHRPLFVAVSRAHPDSGETRTQNRLTAWAPGDVVPNRGR